MVAGKPIEKMIIVDQEKCSGCGLCAIVCSFDKQRIFNPFKGWVRVYRYLEKNLALPAVCEECENSPCIDACPTKAIERVDGIVKINEDKCIGCRLCFVSCPHGAIFMDKTKRVATKCTLCDGKPLCARVCPRDVFTYVERTPENMRKRDKIIEKNYRHRERFPDFYKVQEAPELEVKQ